MNAKPHLRELQTAFLAALFDDGAPGPVASISGNGLAPEARLRIYRRSCTEIQTAALRTSYPAVLALVGQDWFDQTARHYRSRYPSHSGNLQELGEHFADFLETIPAGRTLSYLADVARLEWLRQETILAADAKALTFDDFMICLDGAGGSLRIGLHNCVRLLGSPHRVLTIWRFALAPEGILNPEGQGENVMLWREDGEVVMTSVDAATFTYVAALAAGASLEEAGTSSIALDDGFNAAQCMNELIRHHLITRVLPYPVIETRGLHHDKHRIDHLHE
ncbi:DNA-binding domain-containing protein [Castellaniella sp. MT123]|uniref:DNA-binding domain-containing protein n=1 Tax=Castellaniella sp. MT123 TaxID=3140381 RepID=UPI0031F43734